MMDAYKSRGFFCLCLAVWTLLRRLCGLVFGGPWEDWKAGAGLYVAVSMALLLFWSLQYVRLRRQSREQWEDKHGIFDERENAVRGCAARQTLRIMAVLLYIAAGLVPPAAALALLAVIAVGGIVYYAAQYFVGERM